MLKIEIYININISIINTFYIEFHKHFYTG